MNNKGQTLIIALIVIGFLTTYTLLLTSQVLSISQVARYEEQGESALWLAEAGLEKAVWCLNNADLVVCGGTGGDFYDGEVDVPLGNGTFTTVIEGSEYTRTIVSTGKVGRATHTIRASITKTAESTTVSLQNAAIAGDGGIVIDGGKVTGNIYSNGPVICSKTSTFSADIYISLVNYIDGCRIDGDVKANTIQNTEVLKDAYFKNLINSSVGGVEYPDSPNMPRAEFLVTDDIINGWKDGAAEGGVITGNYVISNDISLGPLKIDGDLLIQTNKILTMTGTIYVTGNVIINANGKVTLHEDYGPLSGLFIVDGTVVFGSSSTFTGTEEGGLLVFISLAEADPAIDASSGSENNQLNLYAPYGTASITGGTKVLSIVAYKIEIGGGSELDFQQAVIPVTIVEEVYEPSYWVIDKGSRS